MELCCTKLIPEFVQLIRTRRLHQEPAGRPIGEAEDRLSAELEYFQEIVMTAIRTNIQPSSTGTSALLQGLGSLLNRLVNRWVAGMIARREREATRVALCQRNGWELKDIGTYRHQLGDSFTEIARERGRLQRRGQAG